jgi:hypothetical protein
MQASASTSEAQRFNIHRGVLFRCERRWPVELVAHLPRTSSRKSCILQADTASRPSPTLRPNAVTRGSGVVDPIRVVGAISSKR